MPARGALASLVGCVGVLAIGIGTQSMVATMAATTSLVTIALALALTMPLGRRVRQQKLEFAWWLGHGDPASGGGAVVPGAPFEVKCYIRHRGADTLRLSKAAPLVPGGARVVDEGVQVLTLPPEARTEFSFHVVAPAAGRVVLHGLAVALRGPGGLFEVPLYFPNPLVIKVLPRAAATRRGGPHQLSGLTVERSGRTVLRRRGGGSELYELREFVPGDPYKAIAWKASARSGKLIVRELEHEVQETRWIIVDVSGTMRGGIPGSRKLDMAIEASAAEAQRAIGEGDRVGLIAVDGRVVSYAAAAEGQMHMIRIYDALLAATEVVDQDLTDVDDGEVVDIVGRYVRNQDGVDFSAAADAGWNVVALVRHVQQALPQSRPQDEVVASSSLHAVLRRFCRARGIPLPYRPDPRDRSKAPGLADALGRAGAGREPRTILVVTDLDGVGIWDPLVSAVKLARAHGHAVTFVVPDAVSFATEPRTEFDQALYNSYERGEIRRLREAREALGRCGARVIAAKRRDAALLEGRRRHTWAA